ncbi:MAG: FAD-dependent oxidoreductase [Xanthomonadales bacterium]|nr:FAD-dependent oxidoreductase [Xanthomonadales bacterium]
MSETVVIVGAGQAGLQTAISLRQGGFEGRVILLGTETRLPYQRPPLSKQVLKGEFDADRCTLRGQAFLDGQAIDFRPGTRAAALDCQRRFVQLESDQVIDYDYLVIATGARLNRVELSGSRLAGVHYLRTLDDALALRDELEGGDRLVVAGGGYIGLEVAASARALGCEVAVVEAQPHIMQRSALGPIADRLLDRHRKEGVEVHLGRLMTEIHGTSRVHAVSLDDGTLIETNAVLKGLGVRPDIGWLEGSGIETDRGVRVDAQCRTSDPRVFAAGDCAETRHPLYADPVVLESVQNAVSQGKLCAAAILGQDARYEDVPWFWSEQYDARLQMAGLPQPEDRVVVRDDDPNALTVLSMGADRLNAIQCINAPRDYMAGRKLIAAGASIDVERLEDASVPLQDLT